MANQNPQIKRRTVSTKDTRRIFNPKHQFPWLTPTFLHPTYFRPVFCRFRLEQINFNFSSDKDKALTGYHPVMELRVVESAQKFTSIRNVLQYMVCIEFQYESLKGLKLHWTMSCVSNTLSSWALSVYLCLLTWHYTRIKM